jgi:FMN phosphatase YigB (HAD superfamily)
VAKPDRRIFEILLQRHGLDPGTTVFVDDVAANVAAAQSVGIGAVRPPRRSFSAAASAHSGSPRAVSAAGAAGTTTYQG